MTSFSREAVERAGLLADAEWHADLRGTTKIRFTVDPREALAMYASVVAIVGMMAEDNPNRRLLNDLAATLRFAITAAGYKIPERARFEGGST